MMEEGPAPSYLFPVPVSVTAAMVLCPGSGTWFYSAVFSHYTIRLIVTLRDANTSQLAFPSQRSAPISVRFVLSSKLQTSQERAPPQAKFPLFGLSSKPSKFNNPDVFPFYPQPQGCLPLLVITTYNLCDTSVSLSLSNL